MTLNSVHIHTDGACKGNPGPGGWGVRMQSGSHVRELFGGEASTTNNRMELTAVIEALASLKRTCDVTVHTDSEYVRKGITEWIHGWQQRGWKTADRKPVKNAELWQRLNALRQLALQGGSADAARHRTQHARRGPRRAHLHVPLVLRAGSLLRATFRLVTHRPSLLPWAFRAPDVLFIMFIVTAIQKLRHTSDGDRADRRMLRALRRGAGQRCRGAEREHDD